ncbi:hypothetical protein C8Q76DRAFT_737922 [Earliella scabrosa]|nr:hypothetical protein C8Q76DRAFT_737922 [Earliella scabrosa]
MQSSYIETSLVGGEDGTMFSDILFKNGDGSFIVDQARDKLDPEFPIKQVTVHYGTMIDGITVTYRLTGGQTTTTVIKHGSGPAPGRDQADVVLGDGEVIAAVFGRAGPQPRYQNRSVVAQIGFFIFNKLSGETRTLGPFGKSTTGTPFHCPDVIAFGGFDLGTPDRGLSGLFFYKKTGLF